MSFGTEKPKKSQVRQITISPSTLKDASQLSRIYLRAFEHGPNRSIFLPQYDGLFGESYLQMAQPSETRKFKTDIVGTDIVMKATIQFEDSQGRLVESVAGFGRWTAPDGPRKRTLWEWILSTIIYPLYNLVSPLQEFPDTTKKIVKEIFEYQLNGTFGPGGEAHNRRYWYLHMVCVDPDWQGYGVGSALLKWSFNKATESNSVIYLESSPMGLPVYLAKGFRISSSLTREINGIELYIPGMIWEPTLGKVQ